MGPKGGPGPALLAYSSQESQASEKPEQERRLVACGALSCDAGGVFCDPAWALRNCMALNEPLICLGHSDLMIVPVTTVWHTRNTWMVTVFPLGLSSHLSKSPGSGSCGVPVVST